MSLEQPLKLLPTLRDVSVSFERYVRWIDKRIRYAQHVGSARARKYVSSFLLISIPSFDS